MLKRPHDSEDAAPTAKRQRVGDAVAPSVTAANRSLSLFNRVEYLAALRARFAEPVLPRNAHARDARVRFDDSLDAGAKERRHDYYVDDVLCRGWISPSGLAKHFFLPFNAERVSENVHKAKVRARAEALDVAVDALPAAELAAIETPAATRASWRASAEHGRAMHLLYEWLCDAQRMTDADLAALPDSFLCAMMRHPSWRPFRVEWSIFDEDERIVGQIDIVFEDLDYPVGHPRRLVLSDWKNVKYGTLTKVNFDAAWHHVCEDLADTKLNHYILQLNLYLRVLLRKYGLVIERLVLFNFPTQVPPGVDAAVEEHEIPVRDLTPALSLMPWRADDPRHLSFDPDAEFALAPIGPTDPRGDGPTRVVAIFGPADPKLTLGPWVGAGKAVCECDADAKRAHGWRCPQKRVLLPESEFAMQYPFGKPTPDEQRCIALQFERKLLRWPGDLLRAAALLYGKILVCWPSEFLHAEVLARYANALGSGAVQLRPAPPGLVRQALVSDWAPPLPDSVRAKPAARVTKPLMTARQTRQARLSDFALPVPVDAVDAQPLGAAVVLRCGTCRAAPPAQVALAQDVLSWTCTACGTAVAYRIRRAVPVITLADDVGPTLPPPPQ